MTMSRLRHLGAAAVAAARSRRLLPGAALPAGRVRSVRAWAATHKDAALVEFGAGAAAPTAPARTLGDPHPLFHAVPPRLPEPLWVLTLPQGRLATEAGLVITPDDEVLAETTWDDVQLEGAVKRAGRLPRPTRVDGKCASLVSLWSGNFYHWMLDALPRYSVLERAGESELPLVVPGRLARFHHESLKRLGVASSRLVPYRGNHLAADVLVWPSPTAHTGNPSPDAVAWLRDRLGPAAATEPSRRLYVSRAHVRGTSRRRRVVNETELISLLATRDFELIRPELLSFAEQIETFASAEVVVGPHGAAHTNTLFSSHLALVELFEPSYLNACNLALARAAGHDYWYVLGDGSGPGDVTAPLELVEATVDQAILALEHR